jgi:hypothetical protein
MVVDYVINAQEPYIINWWIILNHVSNNYFLDVNNLMREELLQQEDRYLGKSPVRSLLCDALHGLNIFLKTVLGILHTLIIGLH